MLKLKSKFPLGIMLFLITLGALLCITACAPSAVEDTTPPESNTPLTLSLTSVDMVDSLGTFSEVSGENEQVHLRSTSEGQWLSFELDVPEAGRYQTAVEVSMEGNDTTFVWVEDYHDNPDGRTYNITGSIQVSGSGKFHVDGSPLDATKHPIKLHFGGPDITFHSLTFTQLRKHKETPLTLTQNMEGEEWNLVWSDEFEGTGIPDTSNWTFDLGDWGWGNNELQYYTENRVENARQEGGNLIIQALKDEGGHAWSSARLTTRGKVTFVHGKIEFRARVPLERGNWAAGWTLGDDYVDEKSWPYCGEIDILETVGFEIDDETGDGLAHASIHCGAYYFKLGNQPTADTPVENMNEEFHTYSIIWTPKGIDAYVDDNKYFSYSDTSTDLSWPYNKPQNLILNLAMGGGWGGAKGIDETITSQEFVIDYVRVYERK